MTSKLRYAKYGLCALLFIVLSINYFTALYPKGGSVKIFRTNSTSARLDAEYKSQRIPNSETMQLEYNYTEGDRTNLEDANACLRQVYETCVKYNLNTPLVKRHFLYSSKHKALYCWIRKAASTSFTKLFSNLRNRTVHQDYYKEIDILAPETVEKLEALTRDRNVFRFLVVRHPFERLVSSYRDRLENNSKYTAQAWIYAWRIFQLTRPELFHSNKTTTIFYTNKRLKLVPTFKEFIAWLLQQPPSRDDVHWDPYHSHCSICDIDYNFVLKLEKHTFKHVDYILSKLGVEGKIHLDRLEETQGGFTDFERTCKYFETLTQSSVLKLHQRYKIDFEMFDYKFDKYLECAKVDF